MVAFSPPSCLVLEWLHAFDFSYHLWFSVHSFYCTLFLYIQVKISSCLCDISLWCPILSPSWTCAGLLSLHSSYLCWPFLHNFDIVFSQLICLLQHFSSDCNTPFSGLTLSPPILIPNDTQFSLHESHQLSFCLPSLSLLTYCSK